MKLQESKERSNPSEYMSSSTMAEAKPGLLYSTRKKCKIILLEKTKKENNQNIMHLIATKTYLIGTSLQRAGSTVG